MSESKNRHEEIEALKMQEEQRKLQAAQQAGMQKSLEESQKVATTFINNFSITAPGPGTLRLVLAEQLFPQLPPTARTASAIPLQVAEELGKALISVASQVRQAEVAAALQTAEQAKQVEAALLEASLDKAGVKRLDASDADGDPGEQVVGVAHGGLEAEAAMRAKRPPYLP